MSRVKLIIANLIVLFLFVADRYLKKYFLENPEIIRDFILFKMQFWQNKGLAFGLNFKDSILFESFLNALIPLISILIFLLVVYLLEGYKNKDLTEIFFLSLITLGAISNYLDRWFYYSVIDYINFNFWPIFNLADVMIVAGVIGIGVKILLLQKKKI